MAKLFFGMNLSLDGYVGHQAFAPGPELFRHFCELERQLAGSLYGRGLYEVMRYWDEDDPGWSEDERAFAAAWRDQPNPRGDQDPERRPVWALRHAGNWSR
jgi:hypothetical protein